MKTKIKSVLTLLFVLAMQFGVAQSGNISGMVTDQSGVPLPGATVLIKGSATGTTTDFDGNFSIAAKSNNTLVVSFIGYLSKEVLVGNQTSINVKLTEDSQQLDEVIITAMGLERKKDNDISSATVIKSDVIARSGEAGLLQGVAGKTSGVLITASTGDPGAGAFIQIRGQNTILGDSSPLIIVDGVPISNSSFGSNTAGVVQQSRLNDIPASDIESLTVLKGAAAAAVWGSGAANGVIVIQTKRGKLGGGLSVNFSSSLSVDQVNKEHQKQGEYGQGTRGAWSSNAGGLSWGDKISTRSGAENTVNNTGAYFVGDVTGATYYPITKKNDKSVFNDVNRDQIFRTGITQNYNLGINFSANEKSSTYFSYSKLDQKGIINGLSDYQRNTFRINTTNKLTDWLETRINTSMINIKSNRIQTGSNLNGLYLGYLRTSPDFDNTDHIGTYYRGPSDAVGVPNSHRSYRNRQIGEAAGIYNNPGWTINEGTNPNEVMRFTIAPELSIKLNDNLKFTGRYGLDFYTDRRENYYPTFSSGDWTKGGFYKDDYSENVQNLNLFLNGTNSFGSKVNLNWVAGYVLESNEYYRFSSSTNNFLNPDPSKQLVDNAVNGDILASEFRSKDVKNSAYSTMSFDIFDKLLVDLSGRLERNTTLADLNFYPSASLGYVLTDSSNSNGPLSFLKLRASYGQVGIAPGLYLNESNYVTSNAGSEGWGDYIDGANYGGTIRRSDVQGNPNLKVERVTETEVGFDSRFFDNKLTVGFTYYDRTTTDGILNLETPPSTGFTSRYANAAEISNNGIEFDFSYDLYSNNDFKVNVFGNFTRYKNIVTKLPEVSRIVLNGFTSTGSVVKEGEPFSAIFGGAWLRDSAGALDLDASGFPQVAPEQTVIGDPNPDFRAGLGANVDYKSINFSFLFETSQGNDMWGGTQGVLNHFGTSEETAVESVAPVDLPIYSSSSVIPAGTTFRGNIEDFGGGPVALDQSWYTSNGGGFGNVGELFVKDASWVKLREISLNYNLSSKLLNFMGAKSGQIGLAGRNILIYSPFKGIDPEVNLTGASKGRGLDYFTNPGTSSMLFNLKLEF